MTKESFYRELIMDVDVCNESHQSLASNVGNLARDLDDIDRELNSGLRSSWQGHSAFEFFAQYDKLFPPLVDSIAALDELARKFQTEIQDWAAMGGSLAP